MLLAVQLLSPVALITSRLLLGQIFKLEPKLLCCKHCLLHRMCCPCALSTHFVQQLHLPACPLGRMLECCLGVAASTHVIMCSRIKSCAAP